MSFSPPCDWGTYGLFIVLKRAKLHIFSNLVAFIEEKCVILCILKIQTPVSLDFLRLVNN